MRITLLNDEQHAAHCSSCPNHSLLITSKWGHPTSSGHQTNHRLTTDTRSGYRHWVGSAEALLMLLKKQWWIRQWHPTPVLLPGKSHGQRSLVGCSPWGLEELDTTERFHFHFSLSCIGEGNGNPLQCSCLENPRDGRAWWAAVYGIAQSQIQLKWLSSSSSKK